MPTVAFLSPKGGAGKTTAALLLALGLAEQGKRVAMIDADPNKPLLHWASLPGRPPAISVHPAPTPPDVAISLREAARAQADWVILDTEGSLRGALVFVTVRPDLVITPLAASTLEVREAVRAAELVRAQMARQTRAMRHACLFTRLPAAIRPRSVMTAVEQLRAEGIPILPTPLIEKEAFRTIFTVGGGLDRVEEAGVSGVESARTVASAYVAAVREVVEAPEASAVSG